MRSLLRILNWTVLPTKGGNGEDTDLHDLFVTQESASHPSLPARPLSPPCPLARPSGEPLAVKPSHQFRWGLSAEEPEAGDSTGPSVSTAPVSPPMTEPWGLVPPEEEGASRNHPDLQGQRLNLGRSPPASEVWGSFSGRGNWTHQLVLARDLRG